VPQPKLTANTKHRLLPTTKYPNLADFEHGEPSRRSPLARIKQTSGLVTPLPLPGRSMTAWPSLLQTARLMTRRANQ
jgi:hypothetical protein